MPSRLRGDRGWENKLVSILIIIKRGRNRGSFLWGSSTRNTRIERLWLEIGTQFARAWRAFFSRLEELHGLDRTNPHHLWLLHLLFLDSINQDCDEFQEQWNAHPISREGHGQSPQVCLLAHPQYSVTWAKVIALIRICFFSVNYNMVYTTTAEEFILICSTVSME